jgi:hypothetical protein
MSKIKAELEFETPGVPDYIRVVRDGNSFTIPIHTLDDASLDIVIRDWGEALKARVNNKRKSL